MPPPLLPAKPGIGGINGQQQIWFGPPRPSSQMDESNTSKRIFDAISNSDLTELEQILSKSSAGLSSKQKFEICDSFGQTPLIVASKIGCDKIVKFLCDEGANIEACDTDGWTPLRSAAFSGHIGALEILVASGANVNSQLEPLSNGEERSNGSTPLEAAIINGQLECTKRLVQYGAEVDVCIDNSLGRSVLMTACFHCRLEIVDYLMGSGADITKTDQLGRSCLHWLLLSPCEEDDIVQITNCLIDSGINCEIMDNEGMVPLHLAATRGLVQCCELLLENDCDVDAADNLGRTALFLAASQGHEETLRMLLFWNASVDAIDAQGWSALSVASRFGDVSCVEMLLDRGLDENHCDNDGSTPLHLAAAGNHVKVCLHFTSQCHLSYFCASI